MLGEKLFLERFFSWTTEEKVFSEGNFMSN